MSVVITPAPHGSAVDDTDPAGALASTLLSVAVTASCESARMARGRLLAKSDAVQRLEVSSGMVVADVMGSQPDPYTVTLEVPVIDAPEAARLERSDVMAIMPSADEMMTGCTCPDWENPCKHAIAATLTLAGEMRARPELLKVWRCPPASRRAPARLGSRAAAATTAAPSTTPGSSTPGTTRTPGSRARPSGTRATHASPRGTSEVRSDWKSPFDDERWDEFFDSSVPLPPLPRYPEGPARIGTALVGTVDVGELIAEMLAELRDP